MKNGLTIISAAAPALAALAIAAPNHVPYALTEVHADFQAQLEEAVAVPGSIGAAGRITADLMAAQNAAQERLVLPVLARADATAAGEIAADLPDQMRVDAELSQLYDGDVNLVTALVDLCAAAEEASQSEIALMAERMIGHQTGDIEVLYRRFDAGAGAYGELSQIFSD